MTDERKKEILAELGIELQPGEEISEEMLNEFLGNEGKEEPK